MTVTEANMTERGHADGKPDNHDRTVLIVVNRTAVHLPPGDYTGAQIKAAAIAQGAALEQDFVLSVHQGHHYKTVGDEDVVHVRPELTFVAVAADDNS